MRNDIPAQSQPAQETREQRGISLLKRAQNEIRSLRQANHIQAVQLTVLDKLAKISGWQDPSQPYGDDVVWQIDRYFAPPPLPIREDGLESD